MATNTIQDYLDLVTSEFDESPNFLAMVSFGMSLPVQVQTVLQSMIPIFDLSTPPVGDQLDIIGAWVGVSRNVSIPITGIYFTWDSSSFVGWDYGSWQPPSAPTDITTLPDDAFLTLIRAKIAANNWDGTIEGAYKIWDAVFPTLSILIQDHQDMSYDMILVGEIVDALTLALLTGGYLPLKPEGIRINEYFVPVDSNAAFGWDVESSYITGWDMGSWLREIVP